MEPLDVQVSSLIRSESGPSSPLLDPPDEGIRLAAAGAAFDGRTLSLELFASWLFEGSYAQAFQRLPHAIGLAIEDAASGRAAWVPLRDPWRKYPAMRGPNFTAPRSRPAGAPSHVGGAASMPLEIAAAAPALAGTSVYLTAFLHRHVSNTLAVDLTQPSVSSLLRGAPFGVALEGEPDDAAEPSDEEILASEGPPPPPSAPAGAPVLTLGSRTQGPILAGRPIPLDATLALPPDELDAFGEEGWLRSVFVWASRADTLAAWAGRCLSDRIVTADDFAVRTVGRERRSVAAISFDLEEVLGVRLRPGIHHVHLSARHHRSAVLEIECR